MIDFEADDYDGLKARIMGVLAMNELTWTARILEGAGNRFFVHIIDEPTRKVRHPSFPFPLESGSRRQAEKKAEYAVRRANEIRISW